MFTGHSDGLITINIAEADDPFREKIREQLGETYRTLLGHFRHESGHYYWERLVEGGPRMDAFRALFGDERQDYDEARQRHYDKRPPAGLVGAPRQRVRVDAPVGGLGRDVGALPAHARRPRDGARLRDVAAPGAGGRRARAAVARHGASTCTRSTT